MKDVLHKPLKPNITFMVVKVRVVEETLNVSKKREWDVEDKIKSTVRKTG
jgi:hypothetical protein